MTVKKDQRVNTDGAAEDLIKRRICFHFVWEVTGVLFSSQLTESTLEKRMNHKKQ